MIKTTKEFKELIKSMVCEKIDSLPENLKYINILDSKNNYQLNWEEADISEEGEQ